MKASNKDVYGGGGSTASIAARGCVGHKTGCAADQREPRRDCAPLRAVRGDCQGLSLSSLFFTASPRWIDASTAVERCSTEIGTLAVPQRHSVGPHPADNQRSSGADLGRHDVSDATRLRR